MPVSYQTYERVALEDPGGHWELVCGRLREKPIMTAEHNEVQRTLAWLLNSQPGRSLYTVSPGNARLRIPSGSYYVPDICVLRREWVRRLKQRPGTFEVYEEPVPLVVEIWSPSTGAYDIEEKLRDYRRRGDVEIWRIHPYHRTLTAWRLQPDGRYSEETVCAGMISPTALPTVTIDLDQLFE